MQLKNLPKLDGNSVVDTGDKYIPSSLEKKRAIMMYLFFGIMVSVGKREMSPFEYYHLKQSSGWRILFFLALIFGFVLLFIPIIKYLGVLLLLVLIVVRVISVKQSRDGKYLSNKKNSPLIFLSLLGEWFIDLFEITEVQSSNDKTSNVLDIEKDISGSKSEIEKDLE